jgi:hypothetical protein
MVSNGNVVFKKGDIVWAKVRGFPWWPGVIRRIIVLKNNKSDSSEEKKYVIDFIGDNSHVQLPLNKLEIFEEKSCKYTLNKNKRLQNAIEKAKRMKKEEKYKENKEDTTTINSKEKSEDNDTKFLGKKIKSINSIKENLLTKKKSKNEAVQTEKHSNPNIKININLNVVNTNHNIVNIQSTATSFEQKNYKIVNDDESSVNQSQIEEENYEKKLKTLIMNLLNYPIEMPSNTSQKYIIKSLNEFISILNNKENKLNNFYELTKDIIPVLMSFTNNRDDNILGKSCDILFNLKQKILSEIFNFDDMENIEKNYDNIDLEEVENNIENLLCEKTLNNVKDFDSRKINNKNNTKIEERKNCKIDDENVRFIYDNFLKIVNSDKKTINDYKKIYDEFFSKTYNKYNNLDKNLAKKRKIVCQTLYHLLKKIMPFEKEFIQKFIILLEYKLRQENPNLGKKYINNIQLFIKKIHEIINKKKG